MTDIDAANGQPNGRRGNGYDPTVVARARTLIETTPMSQTSIARELGLPPTTIGKWKRDHGWARPAGAPSQPAQLRHGAHGRAPLPGRRADLRAERLINRLYRVYAQGIGLIETRLAQADAGLEEKDARVLATLARTLTTLMALERDDGVKRGDPEAVDPDEIRARLARRLYALGESGQ